jgi:hypothetical protein
VSTGLWAFCCYNLGVLYHRRADPARAVGRAQDELSSAELCALAGKFAAFDLSAPERRIEALCDEPEDCLKSLAARGLDPRRFELVRLKAPF